MVSLVSKYVMQDIFIFVEVVEMVDNLFRIVEAGEDYGMCAILAQLLQFFRIVFRRREDKLHVSVYVSRRNAVFACFKNVVREETWRAAMVIGGLGRSHVAVEKFLQLTYISHRLAHDHAGFQDLVFYVDVCSFKQYDATLVFRIANYLVSFQGLDCAFRLL